VIEAEIRVFQQYRREAVIAEGDGADVDDRQIATVSLTSSGYRAITGLGDDLAAALALTLCFQGRMRDHKSGPRSLHRSTWLIKGLSKHADCWIIVLVKKIE
jgi:hypothetical protein